MNGYGNFNQTIVSYSTGSTLIPGDLTIKLADTSSGPYQVNFDNVQLSAVSAVPEPTTMVAGLGALGLVLMTIGARFRRSDVASVEK